MSAGVRRTLAWIVGVLCLAVIVVLLASAVFDLKVADQTASVVGAVVAVIGLALSVITLLVTSAGGGHASPTVTVRAGGQGSLAVAGDMQRNAMGDRSKITGSPTAPAPPAQSPGVPHGRDVSASGGATAVGGNMADNAIGDDSEHQIGEDRER
ncbi:hypothetical protein ACH40F_51530 [Streptomyces sp. NPDC020794]|uniref:hypothetical protein n=1 Tax=unclassified Streptomyces TaxID=2593676 RepID=UPI0036EE65E4